jgi:uncharacterized protein (DUF3820 family)
MPLGLYGGKLDETPDLPEFYTLEWFKNGFEEFFVLKYDESLEMNRHVLIGELRESIASFGG